MATWLIQFDHVSMFLWDLPEKKFRGEQPRKIRLRKYDVIRGGNNITESQGADQLVGSHGFGLIFDIPLLPHHQNFHSARYC